MRSEQFVAVLAQLAMRHRESALEHGLDEEELAEILQVSVPPARQGMVAAEDRDDELLRFLALYDCSGIELPGIIRFTDCPRAIASGTVVATQEADPIVLGADGELRLHDHGDMDFVIARCAVNGAAFMDSLACFGTAGVEEARGKAVYRRIVDEVVALAGGEAYRGFWSPTCASLGEG